MFARDAALKERFPNCPASRGARAAELITYVTDRPGHDRRYAIDSRRLEEELGYVPQVRLDVGLKRTVGWFLENEPWWRGVLSGEYKQWVQRHYGS